MPRKPKELSALDVRRLSASGLHAVGGVAGLCLNITDSGAKSWIFRATVGNRRREMGLGAYPDVGLAEARNLAREAKLVIARGGDPIEERRAAQERLRATQRKGMLFRDLVESFFEGKKRPELGSQKHAHNWLSSVRQHALPSLGAKETATIEPQDILGVLEPIWLEKTQQRNAFVKDLRKYSSGRRCMATMIARIPLDGLGTLRRCYLSLIAFLG